MSVIQLVTAVVEELGREFECDDLRDVSAETVLFDGDRGIDSLCLVAIVAELERATVEEFGKRVVLADERSMSMSSSPYRTVGSLAALVEARLAE